MKPLMTAAEWWARCKADLRAATELHDLLSAAARTYGMTAVHRHDDVPDTAIGWWSGPVIDVESVDDLPCGNRVHLTVIHGGIRYRATRAFAS